MIRTEELKKAGVVGYSRAADGVIRCLCHDRPYRTPAEVFEDHRPGKEVKK